MVKEHVLYIVNRLEISVLGLEIQRIVIVSMQEELFFFFFCLFAIFWAAPAACGGSQARGQIGAVATSLRQSHSNSGSKPRLQPTPQLTATPAC